MLFVIFIYTESAYFAPTARLQITSIGLIPRTFEHPVYSSYPYYPTFVAQYFVANSKATSTKSLFTRSLVRVQLLFSKIRCRKLLLRCPFLFLQSHSVTTVHRRSIVKKFIVARFESCSRKIINFKIYGNLFYDRENSIFIRVSNKIKKKKNSRSLLLKCCDTSAQIREEGC